MECNPERDQDRAFDTYDHFKRFGKVLFSQQRKIYENIAEKCDGKTVLEAGCGAGIGSAIIDRKASLICATDKLTWNIKFAKELYPWIYFDQWNIDMPFVHDEQWDVVVAVEVIEHIKHPRLAVGNLIRAARHEVWISTPNGNGKPNPPENPFHVREYCEDEVLEMIHDTARVSAMTRDWDTFLPARDTDPVVYHIVKK